jgi:hypothetical protein
MMQQFQIYRVFVKGAAIDRPLRMEQILRIDVQRLDEGDEFEVGGSADQTIRT